MQQKFNKWNLNTATCKDEENVKKRGVTITRQDKTRLDNNKTRQQDNNKTRQNTTRQDNEKTATTTTTR